MISDSRSHDAVIRVYDEAGNVIERQQVAQDPCELLARSNLLGA